MIVGCKRHLPTPQESLSCWADTHRHSVALTADTRCPGGDRTYQPQAAGPLPEAVAVTDVHVHAVPTPLLRQLETGRNGFSATRSGAEWVVEVPGAGPTRPIGPRMTQTPRALTGWPEPGSAPGAVAVDGCAGRTARPRAMRDWLRRLNDAMATEAATSGPERTPWRRSRSAMATTRPPTWLTR